MKSKNPDQRRARRSSHTLRSAGMFTDPQTQKTSMFNGKRKRRGTNGAFGKSKALKHENQTVTDPRFLSRAARERLAK